MIMKKLFPVLSFIMILTASCNSQPVRMFAGSFTDSIDKGFTIFDLYPDKGTFNVISESDAGPNPSYFCISKKYGYIYAANEVMNFMGKKGGGITTLKYDAASGKTEKMSELSIPDGSPCFISLSAEEDYLFLANYTGGSVAVVKINDKGIPLNVTDTIVFEREGEQESHAHMISTDPSGRRIYLTDLGLDRIVIYSLDHQTGKLNQNTNGIVRLPKGSGPRHFVFNEKGTVMYVICELNSTISVFKVNPDGELDMIQTLATVAEGFKGENFCADIHLGKNGKFLYGSNRGENTIVTFNIASDGTLSPAGRTTCGGNWPRNFVIDPTGNFLLVGNQRSGNISLFKIDNKNGIPIIPGKDYKIQSPACLKFLN
jgi:6-phosphogluconolactonase